MPVKLVMPFSAFVAGGEQQILARWHAVQSLEVVIAKSCARIPPAPRYRCCTWKSGRDESGSPCRGDDENSDGDAGAAPRVLMTPSPADSPGVQKL